MITQKKLIPVVWQMAPSELPGWVNQIQALDIRNETPAQIQARIINLAQQMKAIKDKRFLSGRHLWRGPYGYLQLGLAPLPPSPQQET